MNKEYVINFDADYDELESTYELVPPPAPVSAEVQEKYDATLNRALARFSASSEDTVGSEYRFRAECQHDADLFMHAISAFVEYPWRVTRDNSGCDLPAVKVQFRLTKPIRPRSLLWAANALVDGHVIAQTLALAEHYTGKRDMDLHPDIYLVELLPTEDEMRQMFMSSSEYAEQKQRMADLAEEYAASIFGVLATVSTSEAPSSNDVDWFSEMVKLSA